MNDDSLFTKCYKCQNPVEIKRQDRLSGLYCSFCDEWIVVTSYFSAIETDPNQYILTFQLTTLPPKQTLKTLKTLSHKLELNYIAIKNKIDKKQDFIFKGNAMKVLELVEILGNNVDFNLKVQ
ncbi:hypothetical protein [Psychrobacter sp. I-STPA10]|uniref:hypothetical protein n=1 Tax=Psychrobacter sp. I-STPA10 TaxID=2585769 RepID=UPI001E4A5762|nr:hypothetical protein [Psychrobacter sp. I-STPA10]